MANSKDLNLVITGEDATKHATDSAARNFDKLQRKVDTFGTSGTVAGEKFGKGIRGRLDSLIPQFARDLGSKVTGLGSSLASTFDGGFLSGIKSLASSVPTLFTPEGLVGAAIIAAIATVLSTAVAAALAAAVTGGLGLAFLGAAAFIDRNAGPVRSAASRLMTKVKADFAGSAETLQVPFAKALGAIGKMVDAIAPQIAKAFSAFDFAIGPMTGALTSIVRSFTPGLVKVVQSFAAIMSAPSFTNALEGLGPDINSFFVTISRNKGTVEAIFKGIINTIKATLGVLNVLIITANALRVAFNVTTRGIETAFGVLRSVVGNAASFIRGAVSGIWGGLSAGIAGAVHAVESWIARLRADAANARNIVTGIGSIIGHALGFSADGSMQFAMSGSSGITEAPRQPITLNNNTSISLDGRIIASVAKRVVIENNRRQKVGYR